MQERMDFEIGQISRPYERRQVVDDNVSNIPPAHAARDGESLDPFWSETRRIFFIKVLVRYAVGIALQGDRPIFQVGEKVFRDADVKVNNLTLPEPIARIEHLVQVRHRNGSALNLKLLGLFG